ncbi:MAG: 3-isopropylmalate dehydratase large subunit [Chloroflexota bacterium]|nr:3-isopropylmalate dehydratase large subunit [Chloroflexota bacterium]
MNHTFAEKILAQKAGLDQVAPGQIVEIIPDAALSHDNTAPIAGIFRQIGVAHVAQPEIHVVVLDHACPAPTTKHAQNHKAIRQFVAEQGIKHFYDVGRGVCHQVLAEEGFALPGALILGSDSHTPTAGAFGAFAAGIGRSEMAAIMATGRLWLRVPESLKIVVHGQLREGVTSKDLALHVIGDLGADGGLYQSVEWHGEGVESLDMEARMVIPNLMAEMGAKNGYIPPDDTTFAWLEYRARRPYEPIYPDPNAEYTRVVEYAAETVEPMVARPHTVDNVAPVREVAGTRVDQAFLGTCTNGRLSDLGAAAQILEGRQVAPGVRLIVIPASSEVYLDALDAGYLRTFAKSGAIIESPGCGPCMGNHMGVPAEGEVSISTANRNFRGRMGTKESEVYLASPLVVAASAVAGKIVHPCDL